jgi:hypothetical protein
MKNNAILKAGKKPTIGTKIEGKKCCHIFIFKKLLINKVSILQIDTIDCI